MNRQPLETQLEQTRKDQRLAVSPILDKDWNEQPLATPEDKNHPTSQLYLKGTRRDKVAVPAILQKENNG